MLVVTTTGDHVAQNADIRAIAALHGLQDSNFCEIKDSSRLPMITSFPVLSNIVYNWLDDIS